MLGADRVAVYSVRVADFAPEDFERLRGVLDDEERMRADAFLFRDTRELFVAAHALVRVALSEHVDMEPSRWRFGATDRGRPFISPEHGCSLHFNLSHTPGLVAVAIAAFELIGIDIEARARQVEHDKLAARFFAPVEARAVGAESGAAKAERFFWHWTLKEAYLKARGLGIGLPLDAFHFDPRDRPIRLHCDEEYDRHRDRWQFAVQRPTDEHHLALAALPQGPGSVHFAALAGAPLLSRLR